VHCNFRLTFSSSLTGPNVMKHSRLLLIFCVTAVLVACGKQETASPAPSTPAATPTATAPAAPAVAENTAGKSVYNKTCAMCHAAGVAGAPKPGDKADWGPRIAQGNDVLFKHAIEGFTGAKGQMPAKGGSTALTDDEVKSAVAFMVDQSR
jgi:cytochrome c5